MTERKTTTQRMEQHFYHDAEMSPKDKQIVLLLAKSNLGYVLSLFVRYRKCLSKDKNNWGKDNRQSNIAEILRKYTTSIKALAKKVCKFLEEGYKSINIGFIFQHCI